MVEHNLAKVGVASSNLVSRSNLILVIELVIKMSISNDHKNQCLALVFLCLKINEVKCSILTILNCEDVDYFENMAFLAAR